MSQHRVRFTLNGAAVDVTVPAERLLVDVLRYDLGKTGTKDGCSVGVCGLCTVQVDGAPMSACLLLATQIDGGVVRTIEGISSPRTRFCARSPTPPTPRSPTGRWATSAAAPAITAFRARSRKRATRDETVRVRRARDA